MKNVAGIDPKARADHGKPARRSSRKAWEYHLKRSGILTRLGFQRQTLHRVVRMVYTASKAQGVSVPVWAGILY
ncbi:hypothetical protein JB92DRAFT_2840636, partial [Gautieria morchelliformis]